jgi:hypothetical protein
MQGSSFLTILPTIGISTIISGAPGACVKPASSALCPMYAWTNWGEYGDAVYFNTEDKDHRSGRRKVSILEHPQIHHRFPAGQFQTTNNTSVTGKSVR